MSRRPKSGSPPKEYKRSAAVERKRKEAQDRGLFKPYTFDPDVSVDLN